MRRWLAGSLRVDPAATRAFSVPLALLFIVPFADGACQSWCEGHAQGWETKCAWGNQECSSCASCPSPSPSPPPSAPACAARYIGPHGSDVDNGGCSPTRPLATLEACASLSGSGSSSCLFLPGTYSTSGAGGLRLSGLASFTIAMAPAEDWPFGTTGTEAVIDGTAALTGWQQLQDTFGVYYKSTSAYTNATMPWQIFVEGSPLTPARWPNALAWTAEWWDRDTTWARQTTAASCGNMVDAAFSAESDLAATGISFDGCNAIINNEHWVTRRYAVENHVAGTGTFDYAYNSAIGFCSKYYDDAASNRRRTHGPSPRTPFKHQVPHARTDPRPAHPSSSPFALTTGTSWTVALRLSMRPANGQSMPRGTSSSACRLR